MKTIKNKNLFVEIEAAYLDGGIDEAWNALFDEESTPKDNFPIIEELSGYDYSPGNSFTFFDRGIIRNGCDGGLRAGSFSITK